MVQNYRVEMVTDYNAVVKKKSDQHSLNIIFGSGSVSVYSSRHGVDRVSILVKCGSLYIPTREKAILL